MGRGLVRTAVVAALTLTMFVALGLPAPGQGAWTPRRDMVRWINSARNTHGLVVLDRGWKLRELADRHSRRMAEEGRIFHTESLGSKLTFVSWRVAGENVGAGLSMWKLYQAFMKSDPHRANILGRGFRRVGVGVYTHGGFLWVTMIFVG
jgi:uncharacterized protein YkwD